MSRTWPRSPRRTSPASGWWLSRIRSLAAERARKRESLLAATEADLGKIAAACARARAPLRGTDKIAVRVDRGLNRRKVAKHFTAEITGDSLRYARDQDSIDAEAKLDAHLRAAHQRRRQ